MRSYRSRFRERPSAYFPIRRIRLGGIGLMLFAGGCGADLDNSTASQPPSLSSTVIVDTDDSDQNDEVITPAGLDQESTPLTFTAKRAFCCDPLSIEFVAVAPESALAESVTYQWDFGDGRTATGRTVEHTYPWVSTYTVVLTAHWADGVTETVEQRLSFAVDVDGSTVITVTPAGEDPDAVPPGSVGPVAKAGPNQSVISGNLVVLNGSGSKATPGETLTYRWEQSGGPDVRLSATDEAVVTFVAPEIEGETCTLTIELTVAQGDLEASDQVLVIVAPEPPGDANVPPMVTDKSVSIVPGTAAALTLYGSDADDEDLSFTIVSSPVHGTLGVVDNSPASSATVYYTPDPGFVGSDTFEFRATDGQAVSNVATFTILVVEITNAPTALDGSYLFQVGVAGRLTLLASNPDHDDLTFTIVNGPLHGTLGPIDNSGSDRATIVYTPQAGYEGDDTFIFEVSDGTSTSNTATVTLTVNKVILPWLEINLPRWDATEFYTEQEGAEPGMTLLDFGLVGIEHWGKVTNQVLITTLSGQIDHLYPEMMERKPPHVKIFGGVKPFNLPGVAPYDPETYDFADPEGWSALAQIARQIVEMTGNNVFVLENETPLEPFHDGLEEIDLEKLKISLLPLRDTGIKVWWNLPRILENSPQFPNRRQETARFVGAIAEALPDCVFFTAYPAWYGWRDNQETVALSREMIEMVGLDRMQDRLLVTLDGYWNLSPGVSKRCYTVTESLIEMRDLPPGLMNVYPGGPRWILVARGFADALPPLVESLGGN